MDPTDLREVLHYIDAMLSNVRKAVSAGGHHATLSEIDSLVGVASDETRRKLSNLDRSRRDAAQPGSDEIEVVD